MLNQRTSSLCDFGNNIMAAATAITQAVSAKRRIDVPGSSDNSTLTTIQPPNKMNPEENSVARPGMLSRIARASVNIAMLPNAR